MVAYGRCTAPVGLVCLRGFGSTRMSADSAPGLLRRIVTPIFNRRGGRAMQAELINIPTDSLIDMLFVILTTDGVATAHDGIEIDLITRELKRRGEDQRWSFYTLN
jgi:hypothetical protein